MEDRTEKYSVTEKWIYLNHCGVSALPSFALEGANEFLYDQSRDGIYLFRKHHPVTNRFKDGFSKLIHSTPDHVSFVKNTAEALGMIANGYPFEPGDEIISYIHEYPSNHYPWKIQENRGVKLKLLKNSVNQSTLRSELPAGAKDLPVAWDLDELKTIVTPRTRVVAISHVQFTSGYTADLRELGRFCKEKGIDLIVDGAQSLGSLPVYPEEWGIAAMASSGWKWMLGPMGTGFLYTSADLRKKLRWIMGGAGLMKQGDDYLNHEWNPQEDGRAFEYSTPPLALMNSHNGNLENIFTIHSPESIRSRIFALQDIFLEHFKSNQLKPLLFKDVHRSGILSFVGPDDPVAIASAVAEKGLGISSRGGYLRIAPHFYNTEEEMVRASEILMEYV